MNKICTGEEVLHKSNDQKSTPLATEDVMGCFDDVVKLYPYVPSMSIWRAFELAAYRKYTLSEPILDVGCGDGQFFRSVWPNIKDVVGIDINASVVATAQESGVYSIIHNVPAVEMAFAPESFCSVFANCSLEHMDNLELVLSKVWDVLKPEGMFLFSVTTDKFLEWTSLPQLMAILQNPGMEKSLLDQYKSYHHLVSAFPPEEWEQKLNAAGFDVLEHVPIVPEVLGRFNMLMDLLWHVPTTPCTEFGSVLEPYFQKLHNFPQELGNIVRALLVMEPNPQVGSGAVFLVRKRGAVGV